MKTKLITLSAAAALAAGCVSTPPETPYYAKSVAYMKAGFKDRGQAKVSERIEQDTLQKTCSAYKADPIPKDVAERMQAEQLTTIKQPSDGKYLGDWKSGEKIAQSGRGGQYNDNPAQPSGANCYACHQLTKQEVSYGTIGPSLYNFAKLRGYGPDIQKYAWNKVYNSHAFSACSSMPRFGHRGILTEQQIKDVVALLMDPNSPVNK